MSITGGGLFIRCLTCGIEKPCESMSDWGSFVRHGKGHKSRLFDVETGEEIASAPPQVSRILKERGYAPVNATVEDNESEQFDEIGEFDEDDDLVPEDNNILRDQRILQRGGSTLSPEGMIQHQVTLPPEAYVMYNMAQAWGLSGEDKRDQSFSQWVFDCLTCRYELDYGLELCLSPVINDDGNTTHNEFIPSVPVPA